MYAPRAVRDATGRTELLQLYTTERDHEQYQGTVLLGLCSAWMALLGVGGVVLEKAPDAQPWLLPFLPLVPLPLAGIGALLMVDGVVRTKVLYALEAELMNSGLKARNLPLPSHHTLSRRVWAPHPANQIFLVWIYLPLYCVYLGVATWAFAQAWSHTQHWIFAGGLFIFIMAQVLFLDLFYTWWRRFPRRWEEQLQALVPAREKAQKRYEYRF